MSPSHGGRRSELLSQNLRWKARIQRPFCPFKCVSLASPQKHSLEELMQWDFLASLLSAAISVADGGKPSALEFLPLICGAPSEKGPGSGVHLSSDSNWQNPILA